MRKYTQLLDFSSLNLIVAIFIMLKSILLDTIISCVGFWYFVLHGQCYL